jgi:hypothetical protein
MMDSEAMRMGNVSNDAEGEKLLVNFSGMGLAENGILSQRIIVN